MASSRTLFLAVYASNGIIRVLFLPVCYVLLLSPFLTLFGYYFGLGQVLRNYIPKDFSLIDLLPQIALSAVFVLLPTRFLSGYRNASSSQNGRKRRIQSLPYWIPGLRHFTSIVFGGEEWLKGIRKSSIDHIIAYKMVGAKHHVLLADDMTENSLFDQINQKSSCLQEPRSMTWALLRNAFGIPNQMQAQYFDLEATIKESIKSEIFENVSMQNLATSTLRILSESLPDFVTFNSSIVDQMQWERVAEVELTDGTSEAECNLFALVNEFCCNAILPPIVGAQFTESYQLLATDLATFNQRYWALALGLPRLSPIQGLPGAALAQKRLLHNLSKLFSDITNPPVRRVPDDDESTSGDETDADVDTPISKLNELFTKHELPMNARASIALQIIHDITSDVVPLVLWTLLHICATSKKAEAEGKDSILLQTLRRETGNWAQAIQPPSIHPSFPAPPEIVYGSASSAIQRGLFRSLCASIDETRRLYLSSNRTCEIRESITIEDGANRPEKETLELEAGSYIDIGLSQILINSSPTIFTDPTTYNPENFSKSPSGNSSVVSGSDYTEPLKTAVVISIVTGVLQLWEIAPAPKKTFFEHMQEAREEAQIGASALTGDQKAARLSQMKERQEKEKKMGKWVIPKAVDGANVKVPKGDIRVRIRRREGLPAKKMGAARG